MQLADEKLASLISQLKEQRDKLLNEIPVPAGSMPEEDRAQYERACRDVKVSYQERGRTYIYDGVLFVKPYDQNRRDLQYVVPRSLQLNVIELCHDSRGHPGTDRTTDTAKISYWWYGMVADIEKHVSSCKACARRKARNNVPAAPIQQYESPDMPWQRTHIDLTGPLTTSEKGNQYILVVKDALTRYVETAAMKTKTAEEVALAFINVMVYRHGGVGMLISDNGSEFWVRGSIVQAFTTNSESIRP
jgi:hypothetical protein